MSTLPHLRTPAPTTPDPPVNASDEVSACDCCGKPAELTPVRIVRRVQTSVSDWRREDENADWCQSCIERTDEEIEER